ncbi:MAG: hypothetical protein ACRDIE_15035, partial [Chloroflexota bacterium]
IVLTAHRFSNEAFELAKEFVSGKNIEDVKRRAREQQQRIPRFGEWAKSAPEALRPDLNRVLSDARLDLGYILSDGKRPSSTRLHYVLRESK